MSVLIGFISILIVLAPALIVPIIIVSKWQSRPAMGLFLALAVCVLTMCLVYLFLSLGFVDSNFERVRKGLVGMTIVSIIFGLPVLIFAQSRARKRKRLAKKTISETF